MRPGSKSSAHGFALRRHVIGEHHGRQRAERHTVARETGGDELPLGVLADVGKAVVGLDDLSRPSMRDADVRQQLLDPLFEPVEALRRFFDLPGLVILAAEDDEVMIVTAIDTQVVVRIAGVPEERFRHRAARYPSADDVGAVGRELGLQQRRREQARLALQRDVRRDQHVFAVNAMAVGGRGRDGRAVDLLDFVLS